MDTINGKDPKDVSKEEALKYCFDHADEYARLHESVTEGSEQIENLIVLLESETISVDQLPDYGMCDQEFGENFEGK